ncbi:MAG: tRNA lysidine(34) synthetase TilS [bacterium]|nr:tRNA lysidine(34) synthetase TilS [bacterium]
MNRAAFVKTLAEEIEAESLLARDDRVVLGVSGGPDSMALLHALVDLNEQAGYALKLHIAHLDHALRGDDGEKDAAFVQAAADNLGLPCTVERRDVPALAGSGKGSVEEVARRERYAFLERVCLESGALVLAVGHHRDDDAETILHRIVRGTGLRGLTGIPRVRHLREGSRIRLVRPLLRHGCQTLLAYLAESGIPYREDSTNRDTAMMRNRIRETVLPLLESEINPQVREALLRLGEQARWLEEYFRETVHRTLETLIISRTDQELTVNATALANKTRIVQTELIRRAAASFQLGEQDLGFAQLVAVLDLVADPASGKQVHLPGGMTVTKRYDRLIFSVPTDEPRETIAAEIAVHVPGRTLLPIRRMEIDCELTEVQADARADWLHRQHARSEAPPVGLPRGNRVFEEWIDFECVRPPLVVRTRSAGDRFWPLGAPGSKKLSEFLSDAKVDPSERERVAVLCDQLGPVWIIGHRIDERVKLTPHTRRVLRVQVGPVGR